jgi:hypothetical protein
VKDLLIEKARALGLLGTVKLIDAFHTPELFAREVPPDPRLTAPPNLELMDLVGQLVRRGLDPLLIRPLLVKLQNRPLERALVAWDVLASTLIPDGEPLLDELRAACAPLREVLPAPGQAGVDLNAHPAEQLVEELAGKKPDAHLVELMNDLSDLDLAALGELRRRKDPLVEKSGTHVSLQAFGRLLALAHLPTLSAVYLDYLSRTLGFRNAGRDLCETLFDVGASMRVPADGIRAGDLPAELIGDHAEYVTYRAYLPLVEHKRVLKLMDENLEKRPAAAPAPSAQLQLVRAHLHATIGRPSPVSLETLDAICDGSKTWRYAARVRVVAAARESPTRSPRPLVLLHDYLTAFGNDFSTTYEMLMAGPRDAAWKQEVLPLLAREAAHLPHETAAWRPLVMILGQRLGVVPALQQIARKLEAQSKL